MPALTIPACGIWGGSKPVIAAGIESAIAKGGARRGWSDYDSLRETVILVFGQATPAEVTTVRSEYTANRLTGAMTFTAPWGLSYTADYTAEPDIEPIVGTVNSRVTLNLRT